MATPTSKPHSSPLALLIDSMEAMSDDKVKEISTAIDWGAPDVRVFRSRNQAILDYGSKLDILIECASERIIELVVDPAMLDHVGECCLDRRAKTRWGVDFTRNNLWGSACMQSLHAGRIPVAQKCLDAMRSSLGSAWLRRIATVGAQGGHRSTFTFLLSDNLLERFVMIKAPEAMRKQEIRSMREELISIIALNAPINRLKTLAGLLGGHLPANCVSHVSRYQDKPHRAFAVAKLVDMEQSSGGMREPLVDLLAMDLLNKSTSAGVFSPRARWLLAQAPRERIGVMVDKLADGSRYWDNEMLDVVRGMRPVPGPRELERIMTQGQDHAWTMRLDDALKGWNENDFGVLRNNLEEIDTSLARSEHMEPATMAARLAGALGSSHGCPCFEGALVEKQSTKQDPDIALATITQAIMGQATAGARSDPKVRRI